MSHLFLVRHGQGTLDGGPYDQLSELGRAQAKMLAKAWISRNFKIDYAYSGTLHRHQQTAEIVVETYRRAGLDFPEIKADAGFNEIDALRILKQVSARLSGDDKHFRDLAKRAQRAYEQNHPDKINLFYQTYHRIMDAWINNRYPDLDGETWGDYYRQVLDTRTELRKYAENDRIVIFTSGTPMGIYVMDALDLSISKTFQIVESFYNTSVTTFTLMNDRLTLISMNETSHLRDDQRTRM